MQVWRHLLKGVENFTDKKLQELVEFGKTEGSFDMMGSEVVKEVASRFKILLPVPEIFSKVKVSIQGWGTPATFEIDGSHLSDLTMAARKVGANFTIKEVFGWPGHATLKLIAALVNEHQLKGEEGLLKLDLSSSNIHHIYFPKVVLSLLKASQEWKIDRLVVDLVLRQSTNAPMWRTLAQAAATGHIGTLHVRGTGVDLSGEYKAGQKEDVKAVWEITEKTVVENPYGTVEIGEIGGGRAKEELKITFEEAYQTVLYKIC